MKNKKNKLSSFIYILSILLLSCLPTRGQNLGTGMQNLVDWKFSLDSTHWKQVSIPHFYNAIDGHSRKYFRGKAYYRRNVVLTESDLYRPLLLLFEGAAQQAAVEINGKRVKTHKGGYTPFWINLKGLVHQGENRIEVTCDNHEDINLIPVSSDFNKNGGLHNPVWLLKMSPIYFSPANTGLYRLHVATPHVNDRKAQACIRADVVNTSGSRQQVSVDITLLDKAGKKVYASRRALRLPKSAAQPGTIVDSFTVQQPHLWNGLKDPYLYQAVMTISDKKGQILDEVKTKIGFRYYKVTSDKGFFLNGKSYPLRGVAEHQDIDGKASAVNDSDIRRDYQTIKELGCNFLRLAHYPHRDIEYALCDSLGIIVQTEIPWVNVCGVNAQPPYFDNIHQQMREMITSLYNHPSIIFWGMWNELDNWGNTDKLQGKIDCQRIVDESAKLYDDAKQQDPYRLVGVTDCSIYRRDGYVNLKGDFFSENRYNGWYYNHDNPAHISDEINEVHQKKGVVNISEYGAGCNPYCHIASTDMKKMRADDKYHYEEHANLVHEEHVRQIMKMPFLNFTSAWILFDFPVADRQEGFIDSDDGIHFKENDQRKYINDKGLVTRDRKTKKDVFYLYKAWWSHHEPTVYVTGRRLTHLQANSEYSVKVYSNAKSLQLFVDGQPIQTLEHCPDPTGIIWTFSPIKLAPGNHVIRVEGDSHSDAVEKVAE